MKIQLWTLEKPGKNDFEESIGKYSKRIDRYASFEIKSIDNSKISSQKMSPEEIKTREWHLVNKLLNDGDYLVLLDERGKEVSSYALSQQVNQWQMANKGQLIFLIGGAFGASQELKKRANYSMSLSQLTLPHRIAKLVICEQIYRAFSILNGEKYHHD